MKCICACSGNQPLSLSLGSYPSSHLPHNYVKNTYFLEIKKLHTHLHSDRERERGAYITRDENMFAFRKKRVGKTENEIEKCTTAKSHPCENAQCTVHTLNVWILLHSLSISFYARDFAIFFISLALARFYFILFFFLSRIRLVLLARALSLSLSLSFHSLWTQFWCVRHMWILFGWLQFVHSNKNSSFEWETFHQNSVEYKNKRMRGATK